MAHYLRLHDDRIDGIESNNPHDYVICPLCGRKFEILTSKHMAKYHRMRMTEFKRLYPDAPLLSEKYIEERSKKRSRQQKDFMEKLRSDPEKLSAYMRNIRAGGGRKHKAKKHYADMEFEDTHAKNVDIDNPDTYVICPLCNGKFSKIIEYHLKNIHDMTMDEFVEKYPDHPIKSKRCIENVSQGRRNFWRNLSDEDRTKYARQALDNMGNKNLVTTLSDGKTYRFKAKWEIYVAEFFIENGIEFEYEKPFTYLDSEGKEHTYFADFTLPAYNLVIETKGQVWLDTFEEISKRKEESVRKAGFEFTYLMYGRKNRVIKNLRNILKID